MPVYAYRCLSCQRLFEASQALPEKKPPFCPACGGLTQRAIQADFHLRSSYRKEAEDTNSAESPDSHTCGSYCAMHYVDQILAEPNQEIDT